MNARIEEIEPSETPSESSEMRQLRELLFGAQTREWHQRVEALETRLTRQLDELAARMQHDIQVVSGTLEQAVRSIEQTLERTRAGTDERFASMQAKAGQGETDLLTSLQQLQVAAEASAQTLQTIVEQRTQQTHDTLQIEISALGHRVEQSLEELNQNKLSRSQFAGVLASLAGNITGKVD